MFVYKVTTCQTRVVLSLFFCTKFTQHVTHLLRTTEEMADKGRVILGREAAVCTASCSLWVMTRLVYRVQSLLLENHATDTLKHALSPYYLLFFTCRPIDEGVGLMM